LLPYSGVINPVASEYVDKGLEKALALGAQALVLQLDTPGGLDRSMRLIIKSMLASPIPVVVYVAPSGSRAASAGVFITIAAHVAAMAPGTNIGAAHPVALGGGKMDKTMIEKVENDAAAYIRSLAERWGRNADWAEEAVRKSRPPKPSRKGWSTSWRRASRSCWPRSTAARSRRPARPLHWPQPVRRS
jgi:membrane-bound serine protease (ClpP class)